MYGFGKVIWYCSGDCLERDSDRHMDAVCPYKELMRRTVEHQYHLVDSGAIVSLTDLGEASISKHDYEAIVEFETKHPEIFEKPNVIRIGNRTPLVEAMGSQMYAFNLLLSNSDPALRAEFKQIVRSKGATA